MFRTCLATLAAVWGALIAIEAPASMRAIGSYARYAGERLQERPDSDFVIGVKVFPTLAPGAPPWSVQSDLAIADSVGAGALSVYVTPRGTSASALDALARAVDLSRGDKRLIVALDLSREAIPALTQARYLRERVADVERIARVLRPDYVVPVVDPAGAATRRIGELPDSLWIAYLRDAARAVHRATPNVRVMAHVGGFGARDSALYAWAVRPDTPIDAVGISLAPWLSGADALDARMASADAWLRAAPQPRELWILEAAGLPLLHGDRNQARAIWGTLAWATRHPTVKGVIVHGAGDYDRPLGLHSPSGRLRPATTIVRAAIEALGG
jgi:hypothetical protein